MAAIEHVSERLHADPESTDVDMPAVSEESDIKSASSSPLSLSNKLVSSPIDAGNDEFQMKFLVTGTSNRPHHSGKKKVVRIHSLRLFRTSVTVRVDADYSVELNYIIFVWF